MAKRRRKPASSASAVPSPPPPSRRRWLRRSAIALGVLFVAYLAVLAYPQPWFSYSRAHRQIVLYADQPLPDDDLVDALLARVEQRLIRSPLFDPHATYRVFLCQDAWRFALFANTKYRVGGLLSLVGRNVFVRPSSIERDRLIGPSGKEVDGDRTLTYYVTHELAHTLTLDALGRVRYALLPEWKREGFADYLAKPHFDVAAARADRAANAERMDPARSGLYDAYELQLLEAIANGQSAEQLLGVH